jgi:hypothetical protein
LAGLPGNGLPGGGLSRPPFAGAAGLAGGRSRGIGILRLIGNSHL